MNIVARLKELVGEERKIQAEIVRLLLQVEDQKIFAKLSYPSVYEFCRKELGYDEGSAYRHVSAMRLHRRDDRCADKIESGELSLTNAAKVETTIRQAEKQNIEVDASSLFESALNATTREVEKIVEKIIPRAAKLPATLEEKIEQLRKLLANQHQGKTREELLHLALDEAIQAHTPKEGDLGAEVKSPEKRHIPKNLVRAIRKRDGHRCVWETDGKRCCATEFLETDHILPFAHGGKTETANLRTLCRIHNQLEAERRGLGRPEVA